MSVPFKVKALFDYSSPHDDDLQFKSEQIITVTEEDDADWYGGEYVDDSGVKQEGIFPRNFVEKYEPTAPPRPTRTRTKKDAVVPASPVELPVVADTPAELPAEEPGPAAGVHSPAMRSPVVSAAPQLPKPADAAPPSPRPPQVPRPADATTSSSPPSVAKPPKPSPAPPVSDKPSSSAFRDRIAAFNKPTAPPVAPFKPGGLSAGGAGFVKKPFVAPPPSRNAYVPPARDVPVARVYRRDEDPEIREREAENLESAERAGLATAAEDKAEGGQDDEAQPKPTSLKERIALLQRQQMEQANRMADAAAKKDKPKKPPKKPRAPEASSSSHDAAPEGGVVATEDVEPSSSSFAAALPPPIPHRGAPAGDDAEGKTSLDEARPPRIPQAPRRKSSSKGPAPPDRDGNEADMSGAGDTTEGADDAPEPPHDLVSEDRPTPRAVPPPPPMMMMRAPPADEQQEDEGRRQGDDGEDEDEEEDEEDVDPEVRRKAELRARMAKMSGGMGMMGMFGPPGMVPMGGGGGPGPAKKKKPTTPGEGRRSGEYINDDAAPSSSGFAAPPVPTMMALPGMSVGRPKPQPVEEEDDEDDEDRTLSQVSTRDTGGAPPVPGGRPGPPPVPSGSRPLPPTVPPATVMSPSAGSESGDELSDRDAASSSQDKPESPMAGRAPPPRPAPTSPRPGGGSSPTSATTSPAIPNRRNSKPPPVPGSAPVLPPPIQSRPPPPPPPSSAPAPPSRQSTEYVRSPTRPTAPPPPPGRPGHRVQADAVDDEEEEYEGDDDTDLPSLAGHKDALVARPSHHDGESSFEDASAPLRSPVLSSDASLLPPPIPGNAPRFVPPPVPSMAPPPPTRQSVDIPRAAPPPPPPPPPKQATSPSATDEDYDPYNYNGGHSSAAAALPPPPLMPRGYSHSSSTPTLPQRRVGGVPVDLQADSADEEDDDMPDPPPSASLYPPQPPSGRVPPPAPPGAATAGAAPGTPRAGRLSMEAHPRPSLAARRSTDVGRPSLSLEAGSFIATEVDLAPHTAWWRVPGGLPPALQGRRDIVVEAAPSGVASSTSAAAGLDIHVVYMDYSQTIITLPASGGDSNLTQRQEAPPRAPRQDQLEESYERFGRPLADAVAARKDAVVGDGTPLALVLELLRALPDALGPVGSRAFGALVYANMANASTTQADEIRPGDVVTIRNAKFQGKHGAMHAKYSVDVGRPDHVGVVAEWDGTKKKVRAWEQGRENKKVKIESYKLDDLRSGEVKIWRVMPRSWLGWNSPPPLPPPPPPQQQQQGLGAPGPA